MATVYIIFCAAKEMKASKKTKIATATKSRNISYLNEAESLNKIYNTSALIYNAGGGTGLNLYNHDEIKKFFLHFYTIFI